eukprot:CAMPEP_0174236622 /NCGR_PEP_ID=MMETSP0417-20130205/5699_1 /TAXON_ID=242541 /ORGANISM="Mayorella sp, Strain BSH-02190019" /LENGTH=541 /DNA_ID=CAMNT_0015315293 /DNA_START=184 /DNA_END=1806 /DNA_ORIENTATION=-
MPSDALHAPLHVAILADKLVCALSVCALWHTQSVAVPLCTSHPLSELRYAIEDSDASLLLTDRAHLPLAQRLASQTGVAFFCVDSTQNTNTPTNSNTTNTTNTTTTSSNTTNKTNNNNMNADALIIYTSGTTGPPKGVMHTTRSLSAMLAHQELSWRWTPDDRLLQVLPMHHVHGLCNATLAPLYAGATVEMSHSADPHSIWERFAASSSSEFSSSGSSQQHSDGSSPQSGGSCWSAPPLSVFTAVPTVYARLLQYYDRCDTATQRRYREACASFRLMMCGSAALPAPLLRRWEQVSGHRLLERYGMSELGMALSQPYLPVGDRFEGTVGVPMPGVQVRLGTTISSSVLTASSTLPAGDTSSLSSSSPSPSPTSSSSSSPSSSSSSPSSSSVGALWIRSEQMFDRYYGRPEQTAECFDADGFFETGDTAQYDELHRCYRILGRTSVDVLKVGGYKISALEVERVLLSHPNVAEACVLGLPDEVFGQRVAALLVLHAGQSDNAHSDTDTATDPLAPVRWYAAEELADYKVPREWRTVAEIPK